MLEFRYANIDDIDLIFKWANESETRKNSYNPENISYEEHVKWFYNQYNNHNSVILIFEEETIPIGLVRFKREERSWAWVVGINISKDNRGKSFATKMLKMAADYMFKTYKCDSILAYIKKENVASIKAFEKAGYKLNKSLLINNIDSFEFKLTKK